MADINANIGVGLDTSAALAGLRNLQREISAFQTSMARGSAINAQSADNIRKNLIQNINATGQFNAQMKTISTSTESFTNALEKNKLSMGQYFRYAGGASKTFGRLFRSEFETINKVARERVKTLQTQYIKMGRDASGAMKAIAVRPLALDMKNLGTQTQIAAQRQALFNQLLKQGSTNLLNFGKNTQWAGRQLMVGFSIPLAYLGTAAARTFMKMEEQAIRFKRVYGELFTTTEDTEKALENIKKLAEEFTKYGVAVEKTMELAADAAAMGQTGAALTAQVAEATRLAVLGGVEQQQALETTISLTSAFGVAAEDLAKKIDFLNAVENQTVVSIEDLTIAIPKAGPVVQQLGGDVEDLAFFLTAMKEGGINASEGANALKSGLASLINPAQKTKDMLLGLGISIDAIVEGNAGNVKDTVIGFANALDTLDPLNRSRAIEQIFGKFQFSRISTLFQNVVKEGTQAERVLRLTRASTEELAILSERELKRVEDSPMYQFKEAIEQIKVELVPLGKAFLEAVTPIVKFGRDVLEQFNGLEEGTKKFLVALTGIGGIIAPVLLMGVGLVANGVANLIKLFTVIKTTFNRAGSSSTMLGQNVSYMTSEQLEAAAVAASLEQVHSKLTQTFTTEASAVHNLRRAYQQATAAQAPFMMGMPGRAGAAGKAPMVAKYNTGVLSVPGPKGAGDIVPALLSPGEAVIPAKEAEKNRTLIQALLSGKIPKFFGGTASVARVFMGMPKSSKRVGKEREAADQVNDLFKQSRFANQPAESYGHQIAATTGHSFPIFGVGGIYAKPDGSRVFVKPVMDERAALAEMRGTQIARDVHGLISPQQRIVVMKDPTDLQGKRKFLALESPLDPRLAAPTGQFTKKEYVKQLVASTLRGDKDLSADNLYGRVLADVGPAGVFTRASGLREYAKKGEINSMAQQALINLLGVKGGAKKAFAETTAPLARQMKPDEFDSLMRAEIRESLPKLRKTVEGFNLKGEELRVYKDMIARLEDGLNVNWKQLHAVHTQVGMPVAKKTRTQKFNNGVISVPGPKGAGDIVPALVAPGEAIIPADIAQKNRGFISAMIDGKIPGYNEGIVSIPEAYRTRGNEKYAAVSTNVDNLIARGNAAEAQRILNAAQARGFSVVQTQQLLRNMNSSPNPAAWAASAMDAFLDRSIRNPGQIIQSIKSRTGVGLVDRAQPQFAHVGAGSTIMIDGKEVKVTSKLGMDGIAGNINRQLARGGANVTEFMQNYNSLGSSKWALSVRDGGGDPSKMTRELRALDKEVRNIIRKSGATTIFDLQSSARVPGSIGIDSVYAQARANLLGKHPGLFAALDTAHVTGRDYRKGNSSAKHLPSRFAADARGALSVQAAREQAMAPAKSGRVTSSSGSRVPSNATVVGGGPTDRRMMAVSPNETIMTSKATSAVRRGFAARIPGLGLIGRVDGQPSGQGTERVRITQGGQYRDAQTNKRIGAAEAKRLMRLDRQNERRRLNAEKVRAAAATRTSGISRDYGMTQAQFDAQSKDEQSRMKAQRRQNKALDDRARAAATQARIDDENKIANQRRVLAEKEEKRAARKEKMQGMGGKVAGAAGGVAMLGVMGASMMGGSIGETAQQLMLPAMMLPMILPMLTNPIGIAALAIGGLAIAAFALNEQFKKNVKESYELAMATGASAQALDAYSQFSGSVSAGEIMDRRRAEGPDIFQIQEGKTGFGDAFLQSESGEAIKNNFAKVLETQGRDVAVQSLASQMTAAVASGVLDAGQARDIVAALGKEMNDYPFSIEVNSKLISILGPNGENLVSEPLEIRMKIVEDTRQGVTSFLPPESFDPSVEGTPQRMNSPLEELMIWIGNNMLGQDALTNEEIANNPLFFEPPEIGLFVAQSQMALQTQQEMVDSLQLEYEQRIANAKAAGDLVEAARLEKELSESKNTLMLEQGKTMQDIQKVLAGAGNPEQILSQFKTMTDDLYKDDPTATAFLQGAEAKIAALPDEQEIVIRASLLSGDLHPSVINNLLDGENASKQIDLLVKLGATGLTSAASIASLLGEETVTVTRPSIIPGVPVPGTTQVSAADEFYNRLGGMEPEAATAYMDSFNPVIQTLSAAGGETLSAGLAFYIENPELLTEANEEIDSFAEEVADKDITLDIIQQVYGQSMVNQVMANQEYFDGLDKNQQIIYTTVLRILGEMDPLAKQAAAINFAMSGKGAEDFKAASGMSYGMAKTVLGESWANQKADEIYTQGYAEQVTSLFSPSVPAAETPSGGDGGGGSEPTNPFADILRKLKEIRRSTLQVKDSAEETLDVLGRLFNGGTKAFSGFQGMSQQIRAAGGSQPLIDMILGMSDEEWEEWKDQLFNFDGAGNITGLKAKARDLQAGLNAINLGNFQDSQQQVIAGVSDQFRAVNKLISQGFSLGDAYEIVQDQAVATAIAQGKITTADFQTLKDNIIAANTALEKFEATSKVVADIVEFDEQTELGNLLEAGGYSEFQVQAIMSDQGLMEMVLAGETSAQAFADRLAQIVGSQEFLEAAFENGMSRVDEAFGVQEQALRLEFEAENEADFDTIEQAQSDMAALNFELDDYQAALTRMEREEREINEKYDERLDALNKIEDVSERTAQRQKSQISIAEALSRGDVAAAAQAIEQLRAEQIRNSIADRRKVLEASREAELNNLTQIANGQKLSRAEIEELIRDTQQEIFEIEENSLEPAQERIRLAQEILDDEISSLTVLGQTLDEWNNIKNEADLARINTNDYVNEIIAAQVALEDLIELYEDDWADITAPATPTPDAAIVVTPTPPEPEPEPEPPAPTERPLNLADMARRVYRGEYGNGQDRINRLMAEGYTRDQVRQIQAEVNRRYYAVGGLVQGYAVGGMIPYKAMGGMFKSINTDSVPAMLTPGEFVVRRHAVNSFGVDNLKKINSGTYSGDSVYNYAVNVSVKSDANPEQIAQAVMGRIRHIDSQRIRGGKL
jgi:TP901 family phage tail tape measure protein